MSKSSAFVCRAALLTLLVGSSPLLAAVDLFLDLGSEIPGESTDPLHKDQVDVLAWSWGMANSGTTHAGGGGGAGKATFQDLSLVKWVDRASPVLRSRCADGTHIANATLCIRKPGGTPIEYIKIQLIDILVSSIATGGSGGEDRLTENVTLNFAKVLLAYAPTNPDGSADPPIFFTWDIPRNSGIILNPVLGLSSTLSYSNGATLARLTWNSTTGAVYQVWAANELTAAFQRYGGPTASSGNGTTSVTVPADAIRKFFRIETVSAP